MCWLPNASSGPNTSALCLRNPGRDQTVGCVKFSSGSSESLVSDRHREPAMTHGPRGFSLSASRTFKYLPERKICCLSTAPWLHSWVYLTADEPIQKKWCGGQSMWLSNIGTSQKLQLKESSTRLQISHFPDASTGSSCWTRLIDLMLCLPAERHWPITPYKLCVSVCVLYNCI